MSERRRIAILGGGPAGMAAAFELTATPELRARHDVTVHQLGWRLGGKGASGRNPAYGMRIEEHGLHLWFGFYDNSFSLIRRCYDELGRPSGAPLATWRDAFHPCDDIIQYEQFDGGWVPHEFRLPRNPLTPGTALDVEFWEVVHTALAFLEREWQGLLGGFDDAGTVDPGAPPHAHPRIGELIRRLEREVAGLGRRAGVAMLADARRLAAHAAAAPHAVVHELEELLCHLLNGFRDWVWEHVAEPRLADKGVRISFMWVDFGAAVLNGILTERLHDVGFGRVNDVEFREWLRRNGARDLTVERAPFVRAVYDAAFCFERGDINRPNVAAGKAIQDFIRGTFLYKGSVLWKMQAGMGDTIFAPLYEVLRRRGVRFEFFHWVTRLEPASDGRTIGAVELLRQATPRDGAYEPLVDVLGLPCWPSEPLWDQLVDGDRLRASGANLEQIADPAGEAATVRLLHGRDFDDVVLAIPVGAQHDICAELAKVSQRFGAMLENSHTVMTQAFQLWLRRPAQALGWAWSANSLMSCYVEPLDTYCDMSHLLRREAWPSDAGVQEIAYFCGLLPESQGATQEQADAAARDNALAFLRTHAATFWPAAVRDGDFDWDALVDPGERSGEARFDGQYWRGNFTGSERYVLSLAGSIDYRLRADESGFANLVLAGDWTHNGIDGGSVEAAVTSGMLASQALCGQPAVVGGVNEWLESDRGDA